MALLPRSLAVVGADHPNKRGPGRRFELNICKPGELVQLVPEPKNPVDENAVAVFSSRGIQIGYVPAERAPWLRRMIASGRKITAIYQKQTSFGAWIRVAFDGGVPTLPPERAGDQVSEHHEVEDEFYPDPIYPDE
jgi:hypothetical protein